MPQKKDKEEEQAYVNALSLSMTAFENNHAGIHEEVMCWNEQRQDYVDSIILLLLEHRLMQDGGMNWNYKKEVIKRYQTDLERLKWSNFDPDTLLQSLSKLLNNIYGRQYFSKYLAKECNEENLHFWLEVEEFKKKKDQKEVEQTASSIWKKYLESDVINVPGATKRPVALALQEGRISTSLFDGCQRHIFELMETDIFKRFVETSDCKRLQARLRTIDRSKGFSFCPDIVEGKHRWTTAKNDTGTSRATLRVSCLQSVVLTGL